MKKKRIIVKLSLALLTIPGLAYGLETDTAKMEELAANYKSSTAIYKSALEKQKNAVGEQIRKTENSIVTEPDEQKRRVLVDHWGDLKNRLNDLNDKIRIINAGEVVKLSNAKDKLLAFLTYQ